MSYNVDYVSSLNNATITDDTGSTATGADAEASSYTDIFALATPLQSGLSNVNCATCYVACGCNEAKGWSATEPASGSYYKASSKIRYNYEITSASSVSTTSASGTQTLISEGTSGAYSVSATATSNTYTVAQNTNYAPTCYKQFKPCGDDEFYSTDKILNNMFAHGDMDGNGVDDCEDVENCVRYNNTNNCEAMETMVKLKGCSSAMMCVHNEYMLCILPEQSSCNSGESCKIVSNSGLNVTFTKKGGSGYCHDVTCKTGFTKYTKSTLPTDCTMKSKTDAGSDYSVYDVFCSNSNRYGYAIVSNDTNNIAACINDTSCPDGSTYYSISMGLNYRCNYGGATIADPYIKSTGNINATVTATGTATYGSQKYNVNGSVENNVSTRINPEFASVTLSDSNKLTPKFTTLNVNYTDSKSRVHNLDLMKYNEFYIPEENLCIRKNETPVATNQAVALEVPSIALQYCHVNSYFRNAIACGVNIHYETEKTTSILTETGSQAYKTSYNNLNIGTYSLSPNVSEPQIVDNVFYKSMDWNGLIDGLVEFQKRYTIRSQLSTTVWASRNDIQGLALVATIKHNNAEKYAYIYVREYNGTRTVCGTEYSNNDPNDSCSEVESRLKSILNISQFDFKLDGGWLSPPDELSGTKVAKIGLYHFGFNKLGPTVFNLTNSTIGSDGRYKTSIGEPFQDGNAVAQSTCYNSSTWYGGSGTMMTLKHGIKTDGVEDYSSCMEGYTPYQDLPEGFFEKFTFSYYCLDPTTCNWICVKATGCQDGYTLYDKIPETGCVITEGTEVSCPSYDGYYYDAKFCLKQKDLDACPDGYYKTNELSSTIKNTFGLTYTSNSKCAKVFGCNNTNGFYNDIKPGIDGALVIDMTPYVQIDMYDTLSGTKCSSISCNEKNGYKSTCEISNGFKCLAYSVNLVNNKGSTSTFTCYDNNQTTCPTTVPGDLKCNGESCNQAKYFVVKAGGLPGGFEGSPTATYSKCYEYIDISTLSTGFCSSSSNLKCTATEPGGNSSESYTRSTKTITDVYRKTLKLYQYELDRFSIIDPGYDTNPDIDDGWDNGWSKPSVDIIDPSNPMELLKAYYFNMCGITC